MLFCIPRETRIDSVRLNAMFVVLWLGALFFCIWDLIVNLKYTTRIRTIAVVEVWGSENATSNDPERDEAFEELCKQGRLGERKVICLKKCLDNSPWLGDRTCYYSSELIQRPRYDEMVVTTNKWANTFGPAVEKHYGLSPYHENTLFHYGSSVFNLEYTAALATAVPGFWPGLNDVIPRVTTSSKATTIILDRNGNVFKRFEPDDDIQMTPPEVLWAAQPIRGDDDLFHRLKNRTLFKNMTRPQILGSPDALPVWSFFRGVDIGGQLSCYNHHNDLRSAMRNSQDVIVTFGRPVCVLNLTLYSPYKEVWTKFDKHDGYHRFERHLGFRLQISGGPGFFRVWDPSAILAYAVSVVVLLRLPSLVVGMFALYCLGRLSDIYRRASIHVFNVADQCGAAALQLVQSASNFRSLADLQDVDGEGTQAISRESLRTRLSESLRCMGDVLDHNEIRQLAAFCFEQICRPPPSMRSLRDTLQRKNPSPGFDGSLHRREFQQACLLNEDIDLIGMASLFDADRRRCPLERFFTPSSFPTRRDYATSSMDAESAKSKGPEPDISVEKVQVLEEELQLVRCELAKISKKYESLATNVNQLAETLKTPSMSRDGVEAEGCQSSFDIVGVQHVQSHQLHADTAKADGPLITEVDNPMSSEVSTLSMQKKLDELKAQQQTMIQEAVAHATAAALKDLETILTAAEAKQHASIQDAVAHATAAALKDIDNHLLKYGAQLQWQAKAEQLGVEPKPFSTQCQNLREVGASSSHVHLCMEAGSSPSGIPSNEQRNQGSRVSGTDESIFL